jgi:SsrA-binding protein
MAKKHSAKQIVNRRASYDYALDDEFVVGIVLTGRETKALRLQQGNLQGAYVTLKDSELWLVNATISGAGNLQLNDSEKTRSRKLLAKRSEIAKMQAAKQQGRALVPLKVLTGGRFIKLRIGVGRGKREYDKRHTIKARDEARQMAAARTKLT